MLGGRRLDLLDWSWSLGLARSLEELPRGRLRPRRVGHSDEQHTYVIGVEEKEDDKVCYQDKAVEQVNLGQLSKHSSKGTEKRFVQSGRLGQVEAGQVSESGNGNSAIVETR